MANTEYTNLTDTLETIYQQSPRNSESANRRVMESAIKAVWASGLSGEEKQGLVKTIQTTANPSGYYYNNSGIPAAHEALSALIDASTKEEAESATQGQSGSLALNLRNLRNLVSDGAIFSVRFIKRSTGEVRNMTCRLGVKKHLKGGNRAYDPKQHNLLAVFDMAKKGYRSIPVDAIQALTVNGQTFTAEV